MYQNGKKYSIVYQFDLTFLKEWHVISGLQKGKEHLETIERLKSRN